ncbi:single-stranded DNA-binding protein [Bifidobacterium leontopitheci]|uniref:Single-stranded DNA-binding protein n=1 Tax=Bifidobacterium leontopitheci TaxID=2650774 RepID=A0A6I1GKX3_9BIFI|nr:single-stranded DNA-binding protein [Bifidobacterium leontopitheci]KAB7790017.1 Single-strand DNA-binding protein [Bifidobacterium leontopitheci]
MAIQQGMVTITGFIGAEPESYSKAGAKDVCSFRVGSTRGYRELKTGQWRSLPTTWLTVKAFRTLAVNVRHSLHRGDAVIVTGVLATDEWVTQKGEKRSRTVLEASNIGHDLNYGITELKRVMKANRNATEQEAQQAAGAANAAANADGTGIPPAGAGFDPHVPPGNGQVVTPVDVLSPPGAQSDGGQSDAGQPDGGQPGGYADASASASDGYAEAPLDEPLDGSMDDFAGDDEFS